MTNLVRINFNLQDEAFTIEGNLTTAPEPGSLALFGSSLLGFAVARRRKRKTG